MLLGHHSVLKQHVQSQACGLFFGFFLGFFFLPPLLNIERFACKIKGLARVI